MTRVLIVDDSVVARKVITRAFEHEATVDVVGAASNGTDALVMVESLRPDAVILDLEMPGMDGLETLAAIRRAHRRLPVIIFSHLTARGAKATVEALLCGATDFALKPTADGGGMADAYVRQQLLPLLDPPPTPALPPGGIRPIVTIRRPEGGAFEVIVMAASTGGPAALATVIGGLPADLGVPVLVVQHMPVDFTRMLAERLDRQSALSVVEGHAGDLVEAARVYIAPGGRHMVVARLEAAVDIIVHGGPRENSCRPSADVLFRSAAEVYGTGVLAVVLTGIGQDGLGGARAVRDAGGSVIAQSEDTSTAPGMPGAVIAAGVANAVVPLELMAGALVARLGSPART